MRRICGSEKPWTSWAPPFSWACLFLFRRKLRLVDIFLPSFFFFPSLSSRTHAFSTGRRNVWLEVALGKTNKVRRFAWRQPSSTNQFNKMQPEKKLLACWCQRGFLRKPGERSHLVSRRISFRGDVYLISLFFSPWTPSWPLWLRRLRQRPHGK